jgi:serine/threonine protein kinase
MTQEREELHQRAVRDETLGRYHLLRRIGHGNTGETWLAEDPRLHRQVAVKMLPPRNQHDHEYATRFEREARAIATLNHPHILPIHDYGERLRADGQVVSYLVMPYIEGGSLDTLLKQRSLSQEEALTLLSQAAEALDYAHSQNALHHDIKPANMLVRSDLRLLLSDFGITRIVASNSQLTESDAMPETPAYIAPEQQTQGHTVAASDLYSLAVVAYQLLTGHLPFQPKTGAASISLHRAQSPSSPRRWKPALPPDCEAVLLRGLAKQPEARYPSAHEFVEALTHALDTPASTGKRVTRRHLLIGAGLAAIVGTGVIWAAASGHLPFITSSFVKSSPISSPPDPDAPSKILRGHKKPAHALAWSPASGSVTLASACNEDTTIKLWNLQTFSAQQTMISQSTASKDLHRSQLALAWSPDGRSLALGGTDAQGHPKIDIYRSDLGGLVAGLEQGFTLPASTLNGLGWTKQTLLTALYTTANDKGQRFSLVLWDTQKPALQPQPAPINGVLSPSEYESTYHSLVASPDGTRLAIGTTQGALVGSTELAGNKVIWKPASFSPLQYLPGQRSGNAIDLLTWAASGKSLFSIIQGNPNVFFVWNISANRANKTFNVSKDLNNAPNFTAIATYPNTQKVLYAGGTQDGKVYLWDDNSGLVPIRIFNGGTIKGRIISLAWSHDGAWLAASYDDSDASIAIWSL